MVASLALPERQSRFVGVASSSITFGLLPAPKDSLRTLFEAVGVASIAPQCQAHFAIDGDAMFIVSLGVRIVRSDGDPLLFGQPLQLIQLPQVEVVERLELIERVE
jgi:hypothetical protein